jgi:uncharacterized membrane protein YfcA
MIFHSSFQYSYLWLPLIGFIIGFFASLIGGGGGFIILPILTLFFNVPAQVAVATSLAATLPICIFGSLGHYRNGNVDIRIGSIFAITGIFGAFSGAGLTSLITPNQLKTFFGIYSILIASLMLYNNWKGKKAKAKGNVLPRASKWQKIAKGSSFGFLAGIISGTFGTSGTAPVLAGLFAMHMPLKLVVGTSLMVIFINTVSALGAHFLVGEIDLTLVYFLTAGAIIGALVGPKLLADVNIDRAEGPIRNWYALGMIAFGILMITIK